MHDVACEFACAVTMRSSNGPEDTFPLYHVNQRKIKQLVVFYEVILTLMLSVGKVRYWLMILPRLQRC